MVFLQCVLQTILTWEQSEAHVCNLASQLEMQSSDFSGSISRTHRLGVFSATKIRPIIVKFSSSKVRDRILSRKAKLKSSGVSVGEDFCRTTRQSRKKLIEFGNASGQRFSLRNSKLVMNKKTYVYCAATDEVCDVTPNQVSHASSGSASVHTPRASPHP